MDMELIKNVIALMKENDLREFDVEEKDFKLSLKRGPQDAAPSAWAPPMMPLPPMMPAAQAAAPVPEAPGTSEDSLPAITSPMVGTFYRSSSPDAEPFVKVGSTVTKDSVVCIIEAMKVMNEIKAEMSGTVTKILVENATAVQFGQKLFVISPN